MIFLIVLFLNDKGYVLAPIITIFFYLGVENLLIDFPIAKRKNVLDKDAIFFFEILALTLENGKNLKSAIEITCDAINNEVSYEFKKVLKEVRMGKSLNDALQKLKLRIPSDNLNNVILNIIQANKLGTDVVDSLHNQVEFLREKRFLEVKGNIQKMPIKVSIISVLFYIPLILLLILSPVLINFIIG